VYKIMRACIAIGFACAAAYCAAADSLVFTKAKAGYVQALCFCERRMHGQAQALSDCERLYDRGRALWLSSELGAADTAPNGRAVQTAWPANAQIPAPSVAFAAWILALVDRGCGVFASPRLSPDRAQQVLDLGGLVFAERNRDVVWVVQVRGRRARQPLVLSDGSLANCDHAVCTMASLRQWVVVTPAAAQACVLMAPAPHSRRGEPAALLWYPALLKQYVQHANQADAKRALPGVPMAPPCGKNTR
jgi:hypothetical protein